jgi:hypothetical protein
MIGQARARCALQNEITGRRLQLWTLIESAIEGQIGF